MKLLVLTALTAIVALFTFTPAALADAPIYTGTFSNTALKGYDTVSYFNGDGVPVKGSEDFSTEWRGATWLFASQANLNAFTNAPEDFAPQYGGYCAWAAAHDNLAKGDPEVYHLHDGKLYLNYNKKISEGWLPRKGELIPRADTNYGKLVDLK